MTVLSLVIPVYKNETSLPSLLDALDGLNDQVKPLGTLEVVMVVDGSPDRCHEILERELPKRKFQSRLCLHSRNFGSFAAIRSGLKEGTGAHFAVMAADLQEPVSLVHTFFEQLLKNEADVTIGKREGRDDPFFSRMASSIFWNTYRRLVMSDVPPGGIDVFGCSQAVRDELLKLEELNSSLVGLLLWVGFRRSLVPYTRLARQHGSSAWTLSRKIRYLLDSVYSFSDLPVRVLKWTGAVAMLAAVGLAAVVLIARLVGFIGVPGYTPTILTIVFFGGLNSLGLGLIGEYVWRAFENTKRRPLSIIRSRKRFEGASP